MRIAVASGKGGTGKTTVATNLARVAVDQGLRVQLLDCDVEEPNCSLFLPFRVERTAPVELNVPRVDEAVCTRCGLCGEVCEFRAIVPLATAVLVFAELCHSCGACTLLCPEQAIVEERRRTGEVQIGRAGDIRMVAGLLDVGETKAPPVIKAVKAHADPRADLVVIDAPPGTSCPVIEAVRESDLVVLVAEPTPFGLHDLKLAVEAMRALTRPFAVVANRADVGDDALRAYCAREGIEILLEIADDRAVAEASSRGELAVDVVPGYRERFSGLLAAVCQRGEQWTRAVTR